MIKRVIQTMLLWGVPAVLAAGAGALFWGMRSALSVLAGGLWNLVNLSCLIALLGAWVQRGPAQRQRPRPQGWPARLMQQPLFWMLLKFPLLYGGVFLIFLKTDVAHLGFGVGFTVALAVAVKAALAQAQPAAVLAGAHGR
jgi:hypothetical protein